MKNLPKITILIILIATLWLQFFVKGWNRNRVIEWDTMEYYSYLPALFIHNDLSLEFTEKNPELSSNRFWPHRASNGKLVLKMSSGMAIIYSPFFAAAHLLAKPLGYEPDGFSPPYRMAISFGAIIYLTIGLFLLTRFLSKHFSALTVSATMLLIVLATNLWYYCTVEPGMTHVYNFTLIMLFVLLLDKWLLEPKVKHSFALGLLAGLISLIRPTNALVGIFFLLWGIRNLNDLSQRFRFLLKNWGMILVMVLLAILIWMPQMLYWKAQTGKFLYYSYSDQGFFFLKSHVIDGLFSFRKGWLIYTPIMLFAVAGLIYLKRYLPKVAIALPTYIVLNIYIIFSWWTWWYGGSYGARPMIDSYALLSIPLAAFIEQMQNWNKYLKYVFVSIFALLLTHGIFQTFQYYYGAIHWDSMTREAYFDSFGRVNPSANFQYLISQPDYESALKGESEKPLTKESAKPSTPEINFDNGMVVIECNDIIAGKGTEFVELYKDSITIPNNSISISASIAFEKSTIPKNLLLAVSLHDSTDKALIYRDINLHTTFKNPAFTGWDVNIDPVPSGASVLKIYLWSQNRHESKIKHIKLLIKGIN